MSLDEAFGPALHGFYFSAEDITGTPLMAGQLKTSTHQGLSSVENFQGQKQALRK